MLSPHFPASPGATRRLPGPAPPTCFSGLPSTCPLPSPSCLFLFPLALLSYPSVPVLFPNSASGVTSFRSWRLPGSPLLLRLDLPPSITPPLPIILSASVPPVFLSASYLICLLLFLPGQRLSCLLSFPSGSHPSYLLGPPSTPLWSCVSYPPLAHDLLLQLSSSLLIPSAWNTGSPFFTSNYSFDTTSQSPLFSPHLQMGLCSLAALPRALFSPYYSVSAQVISPTLMNSGIITMSMMPMFVSQLTPLPVGFRSVSVVGHSTALLGCLPGTSNSARPKVKLSSSWQSCSSTSVLCLSKWHRHHHQLFQQETCHP